MAAATSFSFDPHVRPIHPDLFRRAGAEFVRLAQGAVTRRDVAEWLVCHYAPATIPPSRALESRRGCRLSTAPEERLEQVVREAHTRVLGVLADLTMPEVAVNISRRMTSSGILRVVHDRNFRRTYAPVAHERMLLAERVAALFVADWMHRPSDYRVVQRCEDCGALEIGAMVEHSPWCEEGSLVVEMSVA